MQTLEAAEPTYHVPRPMDLVQNRLPSTEALSGETISLQLDGGGRLELSFGRATVDWSLELDGEADSRESSYDAVEMRPGVFFVDLVTEEQDRQLSVVLDRGAARAITLVDDLLDAESGGEKRLRQVILTARIADSDRAYVPIARTRELLGRRLYAEYSDEAAIEHIYANSETIVWQWLRVPIAALMYEVGVETAWMWKVGEKLYLVHTRTQAPLTLILLLDLDRRRNVGRVWGYGGAGRVADERCGAKLEFLGRFDYPEDHQPA